MRLPVLSWEAVGVGKAHQTPRWLPRTRVLPRLLWMLDQELETSPFNLLLIFLKVMAKRWTDSVLAISSSSVLVHLHNVEHLLPFVGLGFFICKVKCFGPDDSCSPVVPHPLRFTLRPSSDSHGPRGPGDMHISSAHLQSVPVGSVQ